jgi:hypothetical protein
MTMEVVMFKLLALILIMTGLAHAQRYTSPPANVSAVIGGKHVSVAYYAPSMHGRQVMGGLVPFGQVWCTGANYATAITSDAALQMRTKMNLKTLATPVETFRIELRSDGGNKGTLALVWERTEASIPFTVTQ